MKAFLFIVIVVLPAVVIGVSNFHVFSDTIWAATIMLAVTVAVAGVFAYQSGAATRKIARYCILAHIGIGIIMSVNLAGHWLISREISGAQQGTVERHAEEDRESKRQAEQTDQRLKVAEAEEKVLSAQTRAANAERRRLAQLPRSERRSGLTLPTAEPQKPVTVQPMSFAAVSTVKIGAPPKLTPEQVRAKWWWFLTALAIAECAASVVAGSVLYYFWEWDRNRDGIADHLQQPLGKALRQ